MRIVSRKISTLRLDPDNARKHGTEDIKAIARSLDSAGQQTPIVITSEGIVVKGNGTLEAAKLLGWQTIQTVTTTLTGKALDAYKIADNRTAELSEWDTAKLIAQLETFEAEMLEATGYDSESLLALIAEHTPPEPEPVVTEDEVPPTPIKATTATGDLWILGSHRVLCGDSEQEHDVAKLLGGAKPFMMVTDPPYGVDYDAQWRIDSGLNTTSATGRVTNDDKWDWTKAWELFPGDVAYVWHAGIRSPEVAGSLETAGLMRRNLIIWAKSVMVIGRGNYHHQHEPCWYTVRKGAPNARFTERRTETTLFKHIDDNLSPGELVFLARDEAKKVYAIGGNTSCLWQIPKPHRSETGHSTQKPVECMWRPMRNHQCQEVYDPFLGSGTTLIAAEQLGRSCYAMEIAPQYVDVAIMRWEAYTGREAVLASTGQTFAELVLERSRPPKAATATKTPRKAKAVK